MEEARLAEEARIAEEMHQAVEEEEKVVEEAQKVAAEPGSWEEQIQVLQLEPVAEEEMMAEAAKSGSPNPGPCYHCRSWKWDCIRPR